MYKCFFKHILDFCVSLILLIIISPILLICSIAIKINSRGPIIFKQLRSGKNNKEFYLFKFRTMTSNNDVYDKSHEDVITSVGKFLRNTSIDELPQLFNIIKGDMSLIGPRPWITEYQKYFTKKQRRRLEVLPGLTGLAQCSGRNNISIQDKINYDVYYVDHLTFFIDVKIFFKSIVAVFKKTGARSSKMDIHKEIDLLKTQPLNLSELREKELKL